MNKDRADIEAMKKDPLKFVDEMCGQHGIKLQPWQRRFFKNCIASKQLIIDTRK